MSGAAGAFVDERGTTFRAWTTAHTRCAVRLYEARDQIARTIALSSTGDGWFELHVADVGVVERWNADHRRVLVVNLGNEPTPAPVTGNVLLATTPKDLKTLPPWCAVVLALEAR